jgi:hypothetical protein
MRPDLGTAAIGIPPPVSSAKARGRLSCTPWNDLWTLRPFWRVNCQRVACRDRQGLGLRWWSQRGQEMGLHPRQAHNAKQHHRCCERYQDIHDWPPAVERETPGSAWSCGRKPREDGLARMCHLLGCGVLHEVFGFTPK